MGRATVVSPERARRAAGALGRVTAPEGSWVSGGNTAAAAGPARAGSRLGVRDGAWAWGRSRS